MLDKSLIYPECHLTCNFDACKVSSANMENYHIDKIIEELSNEVEINNLKRIRRYLSRFTDFVDLLPIAVSIAEKHFPESSIVLDIYVDPEIDDSYIVLYIRLNQYDASFIERLAEAESEIFPLVVNKKGWIQLTTDFLCVKE
jgi:hypothetical protein